MSGWIRGWDQVFGIGVLDFWGLVWGFGVLGFGVLGFGFLGFGFLGFGLGVGFLGFGFFMLRRSG